MSVILSSIDRGFMTLLEKPTFWFRLVRVGQLFIGNVLQ